MKLKILNREHIGLILLIIVLLLPKNTGAIPVFPGAVGFGSETRAAYGNGKNPTIFIVTNTATTNGTPQNSTRNGISVKTGSFVEAINYNIDNKLIIFEVSGNIIINQRLDLDNNFVTIAGETAPYPGITLRGCTLQVSGHDVLIKHIRVRPGDEDYADPPYYARDGIKVTSFKIKDLHPYNVVVDHCSVSWAMDENMSISKSDWQINPEANLTVSNCIMAEPLEKYEEEPGHAGKNMIVARGEKLSIIKNLFAHSRDRNPFVVYGWSSTAIVNNLIYNPGDFNIIMQATDGPFILSIVGNVVISGPNTHNLAREKLPTFWRNPFPNTKVYLFDNKTDAGTSLDENDWSYIRDAASDYTIETLEENFKATTPPIWPNNLTAESSENIVSSIIRTVGARPVERDAVDDRIIGDVIHRTGRLITSQNDVGGWPTLEKNKIVHVLPNDPHSDDNGNGYTNMEEWLHDMADKLEQTIATPEDVRIKK